MIGQKKGAFEESIRILEEGIELFPEDEHLPICLAVTYMNLGKFRTALSRLLNFEHRKEAVHLIANCYRALNDSEKAGVYLRRYQELS